jgi:hypothetical protein
MLVGEIGDMFDLHGKETSLNKSQLITLNKNKTLTSISYENKNKFYLLDKLYSRDKYLKFVYDSVWHEIVHNITIKDSRFKDSDLLLNYAKSYLKQEMYKGNVKITAYEYYKIIQGIAHNSLDTKLFKLTINTPVNTVNRFESYRHRTHLNSNVKYNIVPE